MDQFEKSCSYMYDSVYDGLTFFTLYFEANSFFSLVARPTPGFWGRGFEEEIS